MKRILILSPHKIGSNAMGGVDSAHQQLYLELSKDPNLKVDFSHFQDLIPYPIQLVLRFVIRGAFKLMAPGKRSYHLADNFIGALSGIFARKPTFDYLIAPDRCCPTFFWKKEKGQIWIWYSHHNPMRFQNEFILDRKLALALEKIALRNFDRVACPSDYMCNNFKNTYGENWPIFQLPLTLNLEHSKTASTAPLFKEADFYFPAAFGKYKGAPFLFEIFETLTKSIPEFSVYISGQIDHKILGSLRKDFPKVHFYCPGPLPHKQHLELVSNCKVCVSPTLHESYGMAILETLALGIPTVSFDVEAVPEVLSETALGKVVPVGNLQLMAEAAVEFHSKSNQKFEPLNLDFQESIRKKSLNLLLS